MNCRAIMGSKNLHRLLVALAGFLAEILNLGRLKPVVAAGAACSCFIRANSGRPSCAAGADKFGGRIKNNANLGTIPVWIPAIL